MIEVLEFIAEAATYRDESGLRESALNDAEGIYRLFGSPAIPSRFFTHAIIPRYKLPIIHLAAQTDNIHVFKIIYSITKDPVCIDALADRKSPLHFAVLNNAHKAARFLISRGADVSLMFRFTLPNSIHPDLETPLRYAAISDSPQLLLAVLSSKKIDTEAISGAITYALPKTKNEEVLSELFRDPRSADLSLSAKMRFITYSFYLENEVGFKLAVENSYVRTHPRCKGTNIVREMILGSSTHSPKSIEKFMDIAFPKQASLTLE